MMSTLMWKEELVKESLCHFMKQEVGDVPWSSIDDIVLNYIVSILEEPSNEESFDVNYFVEMLSPFLPQLATINSERLSEWALQLTAQLRRQSRHHDTEDDIKYDINADLANDAAVPEDPDVNRCSSNENFQMCSERTFGSEDEPDDDDDDDNEQLKLLQEMFPSSSILELQHCLSIADGETDRAAQLILHRQEIGESITITRPKQPHKSDQKEQNDNELRQHILSRYMYVDQSEDKKEHKPVAPKWEPKKLIRYRNNQIVSMKGEKYTEVKETEPDDMKKTYVTLKPARQYRFH